MTEMMNLGTHISTRTLTTNILLRVELNDDSSRFALKMAGVLALEPPREKMVDGTVVGI